jgi:hypothetical protein
MVQARSGSAGLYPQHLRGRGERIEFVASLGYIPRHCLKTHIHTHTHTHTHTDTQRERKRERERERERKRELAFIQLEIKYSKLS